MPHGTAKLKDGFLTITTPSNRGKKTVPNVATYRVEDLRPDPRVASPAYSLTKGKLTRTETEAGDLEIFWESGEVYHVAVDEYGPTCSCPHATYRGSKSRECCKHCLALKAVGLLPK